jgi:hypothetical protein
MNLWAIEDGQLLLDLHAGQTRAWESTRRIIAILAGTQGGKTSFLPWWLWREMQRCGAGDYLAVTGTFDLFKLKFLPMMRECFEHVLGIGRYWASDRIIELADPLTGQFQARRADDPMWGRIILRSAESGGGLESSTAKAAVLDEAGLDSYTLTTFEAVMRRLSLSMGRLLLGTTLYTLNWLKTHIYDRWVAGDPDIDVIQFDSVANPAFPREEFERARRTMPLFRFNMQYRGQPERPPGLIYDCFNEADVIPPFALPLDWPRHLGLDFGGVHTAGLFYAEEPTWPEPTFYLYREYLAGGRTAQQHTDALLEGEPQLPNCVGGSKSEGQWRDEFRAAGLPVQEPPIRDVELGLTRVYGVHAPRRIKVFDTCTGYLDQIRSYARKLDATGQPTEEIDAKATFHYMDAERYIIGTLADQETPHEAIVGPARFGGGYGLARR